jgi:hypothetical protein
VILLIFLLQAEALVDQLQLQAAELGDLVVAELLNIIRLPDLEMPEDLAVRHLLLKDLMEVLVNLTHHTPRFLVAVAAVPAKLVIQTQLDTAETV